jgi:LysM repeat protein
METPPKSSNARLAAILGLIAAFIVVMVIIIASIGGDGGSEGHTAPQGGRPNSARAQKQSQRKIYVVKPGDCCLSQIAAKTGTDLETLEQANPHLDPQAIHSGDRVKLR